MPMTLGSTSDPALRARNAVFTAFVGSGFGFASWASRIPQIRDAVQATPVRARADPARHRGRRRDRDAVGRAGGEPLRAGPHRRRPGHRALRGPGRARPRDAGRRAAGRGRAVPDRLRQRHLGRGHERRGRGGRAASRADDHAPLPRRVQRRHGGRCPRRGRLRRARHLRHRAPAGRGGGERRGRARQPRCAVSCHERQSPSPPQPGAPDEQASAPADRLAGAADPADRDVRALHGLQRGRRQRLAGDGGDRRLRRRAGDRSADLRPLPGGHDRRTLVRARR